VHTRVEGFVEEVFAQATGNPVKAGEPLLTLYSPELLASQQEYLLALRAQRELAGSSVPGMHAHSERLAGAARRRMAHWRLSAGQIEKLERGGDPVRTITVTAPISGIVTTRNAFPGVVAKPEMELYTIVDLSHVWIVADIFEHDAAAVRQGSFASITLPAAPGRATGGKVSYILPQADPQTRTIKARIEAPNPGLVFKPDMYVDVEFRAAGTPRLIVPVNAVLDTGERKTVFVDRGGGYFEPHQVETGERTAAGIVILGGLAAGERIATSGVFLLDSESQLKSAR
jgi:RND family efflux transporter MFP subunit